MSVRPLIATPLAASIAAGAAIVAIVAACAAAPLDAVYPNVDLRPPGIVSAGPTGPRRVELRFDEEVRPVDGSLEAQPEADLSAAATGDDLIVSFAADQAPGADYALAGEVDDLAGNRTRFLLRFAGWNDRAPSARITEVQTSTNDSKTRPHRDFVELEVLADGNLGGEELSWASSAKASTYRFPGIEVKKGDYIVLHLAPQGIAAERDELGSDIGLSGGIDATAGARDLWRADSPLPDGSGELSLSIRPGAAPIDGLFYADPAKSGIVADQDLADRVAALAAAGIWPLGGKRPAWGDAFAWKASSSRSICRLDSAPGPGSAAWYSSASGGQSPGAPNAGPESAIAAKAGPKAKSASGHGVPKASGVGNSDKASKLGTRGFGESKKTTGNKPGKTRGKTKNSVSEPRTDSHTESRAGTSRKQGAGMG
jgi:hypothetical protein